MTAYHPGLNSIAVIGCKLNNMLMRAATVVQQLCKFCMTCFMFYCMFYFTCDRFLRQSLRCVLGLLWGIRIVWPNLLPSLTHQIILTAYEDLQFAEVSHIRHLKLHNKISVRRHVALALQGNRRAVWNGYGILTTHVVVPQCRCSDSEWDVRQTDNEVVSTVCCKQEIGLKSSLSHAMNSRMGLGHLT